MAQTAADLASAGVIVDADDLLDRASAVARDESIRRVVVLEHRSPIGISSLGDLAVARDPGSVRRSQS